MLHDFSKTLENLCSRDGLSTSQVQDCFESLIQGQLCEIKITALLMGLKIKGERTSDLLGAAKAMLDKSVKFPITNSITPIVDCCGTGGDGYNTYNISTMTSIVLAEYGIKMAKHGNGKVSSECGSADILKKLGVRLDLTPEKAKNCLDKTNFCFLMAPQYHPGVKHGMAVRKEIKSKTIFNLIGPLINPARPSHQLIGVYSPSQLKSMIHVLKMLGVQRAMVVHGSGLDEIAVHGPTTGYELKDGDVTAFDLTPSSAGLNTYPLSDLISQSVEDNMETFVDLLKGQGKPALKSAVAINAGAILKLTHKVSTLQDGAHEIMEILKTNKPYQRLQMIIKETNHA